MSGGGGSSDYEVNINLTALLDVLTNLLFFLLLGQASQQVNMELDGGVDLPASTSEARPNKGINVTIGSRELRVEKQAVAQIHGGIIDGPQSGRIASLYEKLMSIKNEKSGKSLDVSDVLLVMCDKDAPYALLHQVLNTAAEAGFPKFRMAVLME